jgi:vacuolar-type H+-ATPase subunit F/Vma7
MANIVVIGDETVCAGFRLAGVDTRSPADDEVQAVLGQVSDGAQLVVLSRHCAAQLAPDLLHAAQARERPLLVVMPDIADPDAPSAVARRLRAILGIEA